jgi:hypothetical protein
MTIRLSHSGFNLLGLLVKTLIGSFRVRHSRMFYPSISRGTVRFSNRRWLDWARHTELVEVESRRNSDWTPDPFDVTQGRGEQHSRTTTKTFGGDEFGSLRVFYRYPQQAVGGSPLF